MDQRDSKFDPECRRDRPIQSLRNFGEPPRMWSRRLGAIEFLDLGSSVVGLMSEDFVTAAHGRVVKLAMHVSEVRRANADSR
jgi:hypothetical protein